MKNTQLSAAISDSVESSANVLHHHWHPVAWSREVAEKPVAVKLLDNPIVLWRSESGIVAFHDLCIHRGTPLSLGWTDNGRIVCAYHGWQYGADGMCKHIPSLPPDRGIPAKARTTVYHASQRYGLIWVCLEDPLPTSRNFPRSA